MTLQAPRNYMVSDITINWARLDTPNDGKYGARWELQIATTDAAKATEMKANYLNVKEKDGVYSVSVSRKAEAADGSPMDPVRVVDASKAPMDGPTRRKIGNDSKGSVIIWQAPYDNKFGKGITNSLTAVQVTELVEFVSGGDDIDFGFAATASETDTPSEAAAVSMF